MLIDKFLTRGVTDIFPTKEALKQELMSGKRLRVYQGFDPTGPFLHIGHAMGIRAMRILQELGHEVIFLVGDFTAKVGDPDKDTGREMLTDEKIEQNMANWKEQAKQLIDFEGENPVQFKRNYEWLSKLQLIDVIKLMSQTTVQQMLERDLFDRRIKKQDPIGLQEFIYPLMQAYDGVAMNVDIEMGGTDQIFNMLVGRQVVKNYLNKEKYVRANILMEAPDARTMSKTKGNGINLVDTAENMFGKAMSYPDTLILKGFELLTDVDANDILEIGEAMEKGENPMKYKKQLAFEIVKIIRGTSEAERARDFFEKTVQHKEFSEENSAEVHIEEGQQLLLLEAISIGLANKVSNSEIKRIITQGGVEVDGEKVVQPDFEVTKGQKIKFGKREYIELL